MKALLIHAKEFYYRARSKAIADAEELGAVPETLHLENVLVAFTTVEEVDAQAPSDIAEKAALDIDDVVRRVGAKNVLIYPYAHLSSKLAPGHVAVKILRMLS